MVSRRGWRRLMLTCVAVGTVAVCVSTASAATLWSDPPVGPGSSGSNAQFGWSAGQNNVNPETGPGFGNPTDHLWGFDFPCPGFSAVGGGGSGDSTSDLTRVTMDRFTPEPDGAQFDFILVREWGTYLGDPDFLTIQTDFSVFWTDPSPPGNIPSLTMPETWIPDDVEHPELGGTWFAERTILASDYLTFPLYPPGSGWNTFQITVTNAIQVDGSLPSGSFIEKKGMRIVIPEPSTVLFGLAGFGLFALRRSRRGC